MNNKSQEYIKLSELGGIYDFNEETLIELVLQRDDLGIDSGIMWGILCDNASALREVNKAVKDEVLAFLSKIRKAETQPSKKTKTAKKTEETPVLHTSLIEDDGVMYEEIYRDNAVYFIDSVGNEYKSINVDGITYEPIMGDELTLNAVKLPSGIEDYDTDETLIEEIKSHLHKYTDVTPFFETVSAYYIFLTWLYDELNTLPYLRVLGDTGTGKSRYEDTVGRLCYKASFVSGALTPAPIYRLIGKWGGTIIIDEADFKSSNEKNEVIKLLNCGFERDRPVCRCQTDNPDNLLFLPTFSPKLIASRRRFADVALESRCLTEVTLETSRTDIPYLLPPEFYEDEIHLRNKLLAYRFKRHGNVDIVKAQGMAGLKIENRLKQTMSPFMVLFADNEKVYKGFIKFLEEYNRELVEVRADTFEGAIVNAIFEIIQRTLGGVSQVNDQNGTNGLFTNEALNGVHITATDIADTLKENHGLRDVTSRGIGRRLKTLGITSTKKGTGAERNRYLDLEQWALAKLIAKYVPTSDSEKAVTGIRDVDLKEGAHKTKNICDACGKDRICTLCNNMWLCDECITEQAENGLSGTEESIKTETNKSKLGNRDAQSLEGSVKKGDEIKKPLQEKTPHKELPENYHAPWYDSNADSMHDPNFKPHVGRKLREIVP